MSLLISIAPSFPCQSVYKIANLLSPPTKYSLISSSLWNEIVQDLYLTYSVFKYINYLSQYPYPEYIQPAIDEFLNFPYQFTPYSFTPLLVAQKGIPLTADEFNKLIDAIIELANEFDINLKTQLRHVQRDQIVRSSQFSNVIYAINQLLTFDYNTYFLLSCSGYEFGNLLGKQNTFLNALIGNLQYNINIPSSTYIKNLLIYTSNSNIYNYGAIDKLAIMTNNGEIYLYGDAFINFLAINNNKNNIYVNDYSIINTLVCNKNTGIVFVSKNAFVVNNQCPNPSMILSTSLPGFIYPNGRIILNSNLIAFQIQPGTTGTYAILINQGNPSAIPDPTTISQNVDYSNITGVSIIGNYIIFGGGEIASSPWSPCAAPCSPYQAFYNKSTGQLTIWKIQGGSCDNMNMSGAVPGNNGDIITFGGADQGSTTGTTGYVIYNSSIQPYLYGMLSGTDNQGNTLNLYRKPYTYAGSTVYFIARNYNNSHALLESVDLSQLYSYASSSVSVLCGTSNTLTPTFIADIVPSWNSAGTESLYYDNGIIYFLYNGGNGYVQLTSYDLSTGAINTINLVPTSSSGTFLEIVNGIVYVGLQNSNTFTVYKFSLDGSLIESKSFNGEGFIDPQGLIAIFSNGLNAGSVITIEQV